MRDIESRGFFARHMSAAIGTTHFVDDTLDALENLEPSVQTVFWRRGERG